MYAVQDIGYWASYNQVFDEELSAYSGNTQLCEATREEFRQRVGRTGTPNPSPPAAASMMVAVKK